MQTVLKDVPVETRPVPEGLIQAGGDYYYAENPPGTGVPSVGLSDPLSTGNGAPPVEQEKPKDDVKNLIF
jgi:penicillin-binding protein 1A